MPRGLVHVAGSERCVLSYRGCTSSQTILEIRIQRGGISIQGATIWAVLGYLDDWLILAQSEAVSISHKTLLISHLGCLGIRVNFAKSILSRSQRVSFLGTVIDCLSGASHDDSSPRGFLQGTKRAHFSTSLMQMLCRHCKTCRTPLHAAWVAYQYKVLPFGLSLAAHTFTRCMDTAFSPLRQMRIPILNYLDDWLILAQSEAVSTSHKTLLISHLGCLGIRVNFAKSILSPSQRVSFLGTVIDSVQMTATVSAERAMMIQSHAASFKEDSPSAQSWLKVSLWS